jgi:proline iminopeptidase
VKLHVMRAQAAGTPIGDRRYFEANSEVRMRTRRWIVSVIFVVTAGSSASAQPLIGEWEATIGLEGGVPLQLRHAVVFTAADVSREALPQNCRPVVPKVSEVSGVHTYEQPAEPARCGGAMTITARRVGVCVAYSERRANGATLEMLMVRRWPDGAPAPRFTDGFFEGAGAARLRYQVGGAGPTLLILTGGPGDPGEYLQDVATTLARDARVILLDRRGTGRSVVEANATTMTLANEIEDVERLRRHLGVERWSVLGHSHGAILGTAYAAAHAGAIDRLLLVGSPGLRMDFQPEVRGIIQARLSQAQRDSIVMLLNRRGADSVAARSAAGRIQRNAYMHDPRFAVTRPPGTRNLLVPRFLNPDLQRHYDVREAMARFDRPVLLLWGRSDIFDVRRMLEMHRAIPRSELAILEHAGHFPWEERPADFREAVARFLCEAR